MFKLWLVSYSDPGKSNFILETAPDIGYQAVVDYLNKEWSKEPVVTRLHGTRDEVKSVFPHHSIRTWYG